MKKYSTNIHFIYNNFLIISILVILIILLNAFQNTNWRYTGSKQQSEATLPMRSLDSLFCSALGSWWVYYVVCCVLYLLCRTVQYYTVQYSTVQYSIVQYSIVQYSIVLCTVGWLCTPGQYVCYFGCPCVQSSEDINNYISLFRYFLFLLSFTVVFASIFFPNVS